MKKIIGITGGSGSGKTYICNALSSMGYTIIDADKISRKIVSPGCTALNEIFEAFGERVRFSDGTLNRKALADIVFTDNSQLKTLNQITHKYIIREINHQLSQCDTDYCVIDAPLLYEAGLDKLCDVVIGVTANIKVRINRIIARDNLTYDAAITRLGAQHSIEANLSRVNLCIDTTDSPLVSKIAAEIHAYIQGV